MDKSQNLNALSERPAGAQKLLEVFFNPQRETFLVEVVGLHVTDEESREIAAQVLGEFQNALDAIFARRPRGSRRRGGRLTVGDCQPRTIEGVRRA